MSIVARQNKKVGDYSQKKKPLFLVFSKERGWSRETDCVSFVQRLR